MGSCTMDGAPRPPRHANRAMPKRRYGTSPAAFLSPACAATAHVLCQVYPGDLHDDFCGLRRMMILAIVATLMAVDLIPDLCRCVARRHRPDALVLHQESTLGHSHKAHLSPELAPRVPHDPIETVCWVGAPANHRDDMVNPLALILDNASFIIEEGVGVDATGDGAAQEDLLHHRTLARDGAILRDGDIRVLLEARTRAALLGEAAASAGHIDGFACGVHVLA